MGLGGTTKKLQKIANMAEELYARLNDLREQLAVLRETVERTNAAVEQLQREQTVNRTLLERVAEEQGIDVNEVVENVSMDEPTAQERSQGQGQQQGQRQHQQQNQGQQQQQHQHQQADPDPDPGSGSGSSSDRPPRDG